MSNIIIGNCLDVLRTMPSDSIDCVVTSPPYWSLRDYQSEPAIWGGDAECEHDWHEHIESARGGVGKNANVGANRDGVANNRGHPTVTQYCHKCGAWKGQLGLEPTPFEYIEHLLMIFDEVKRVLKPTGACWVNIGDTYNGAKNGKVSTDTFHKETVEGIGKKSLVQIPSRFAIGMTDHGWILRNEIIWHKPNVMPQSMKDRFTVDFEKMYFFTKEPTYYFVQQKEQSAGSERNMRTTWSISTQASSEDHCAMFPQKLVEIPIMSTCQKGGTVLDIFCGSGTTLEWCFMHNIEAIGIEINPKFKPIIEKRMRKGQTRLEVEV